MSPPTASGPGPRPALMGRAVMLFVSFLLVILAYYQVKAASRSLLLEHGGTEAFPYVWIGSALTLLAFIGVYNRLVERLSRLQVVVGSLFAFAAILVAFRVALSDGGITTVVAFYIFVDLFSVVLVEQFWSLANSITRLDEGHRSYWFIATGGLVGGVAGGLVAAGLLRYTAMHTVDLLLSCAAMLLVTGLVNLAMGRRGAFVEVAEEPRIPLRGEGLRAVLRNRYLVLIALVVCLSQLAEPVVEFQFLRAIAEAFPGTDERTDFISRFFSVMGFVSIGVNLFVTPAVHRYLGTIAGLAVQPVVLAMVTLGYSVKPTLGMAATMKIADRGLSYSINRASKEILFIPVDPVLTFQAKAWIDMLGYRMFKVLGSGLIVAVTAAVPAALVSTDLAWLTLVICAAWVVAVIMLGVEQRRVLVRAAA
ncbi:MAG: ATP translocase [Gammaproteobacteria bacterium]|nr:ATP translocase [Gammaproteobacteria bacterium]MCP5199010.1 ATP translocase [Gammaproteobacteria bacterium]